MNIKKRVTDIIYSPVYPEDGCVSGWSGNLRAFYCQAGSYLGVSILGTSVHFSLMALLVRQFDLNPVGSSIFGAVMGAAVIYHLNFYFTFHSSAFHKKALTRFIAMAAAGTMINGLVLALAFEVCSVPLVLSQAVATAVQFIFGFIVSLLWIY